MIGLCEQYDATYPGYFAVSRWEMNVTVLRQQNSTEALLLA